jgi:NADH-quinone oxidoreductase subunit E
MGGGKMDTQQASQQPEIDLSKVDQIIDDHNCDRELLISILQDIQGEFKYIPQNALIRVSEKLNLSLTQIYGVATFFKAFSLQPKGKHLINICLGTACHVRQANEVLNRVEQDLNIKNGETTSDMQFTIETVNCLGACALGPIMVIDGEYHGNMNPAQVTNVLKKYKPTLDNEDEGSVDE